MLSAALPWPDLAMAMVAPLEDMVALLEAMVAILKVMVALLGVMVALMEGMVAPLEGMVATEATMAEKNQIQMMMTRILRENQLKRF